MANCEVFVAKELMVHSFFPGVLFRALKLEGVREQDLLRNSGLTAKAFEDPLGIITLSQHQRFIINAISLTQDEHLGLRLGNALNITNLGILGYAAISCRHLEQALSLITEFFEIRTPLLSLKLRKTKRLCYVEITEHFVDVRLHYFMQLATMSGVVKLIRYLLQSESVEFCAQCTLPAPATTPELPGVDFRFNQSKAQISFPKHWLKTPLPLADPQTAAFVTAICREQLAGHLVRIGWAQKVLAILTSTEGKLLDLTQCAVQLNVSGRTLRRKLEQENIRFQQLTDQVQFQRAKAMLLKNNFSVQQTSVALGFSDFSNFGRAFRRWSGVSPGEYQARNMGDATDNPH